MSNKNILVRFEGGIGDCLLSNRFLFAVKEKYPEAIIKVAFDTGVNAGLLNNTIIEINWSIYFI